MRRIISVTVPLLLGAAVLSAQTPRIRPEIRPWASATIPIGSQRDVAKVAPMFGVQTALEVRENFHLVGSFGWMPGQAKYTVANNDVNVLAYDIGAELGLVRPLGGNWQFKPFIGVGGGARTYLFQSSALQDKTCAAGYGALGTEFQLARVALRLEGRQNVFCYRSPIVGQESKTRTDLGVGLGLAYHIR